MNDSGLIVIVCGGRDYRELVFAHMELDKFHANSRIAVVIQGGADGADALARSWARSRKVKLKTYEADWTQGKAAGPIRNRKMLEYEKPDLVIAFPGGEGTKGMVRMAEEAGVRVVRFGE